MSICETFSIKKAKTPTGLPRYEGFPLVLLYAILPCLAVLSWRSALFKRGKGGRVDLEERGGGEGARRSRERRNCSWNVLYERKICF